MVHLKKPFLSNSLKLNRRTRTVFHFSILFFPLLNADMGEINQGGLPDLNFSKSRGGLPDLDLDFSKSRGGLPDLDLNFSKSRGGLPDLDPTRLDFCRDIIPLEILSPSRYLAHIWLNVQPENTVTVGGSITVRLVSSFSSLDSTASQHTKNHIFYFLVKSNLVKLETSCTVIILPRVSVLWLNVQQWKEHNTEKK